MISRPGLAGNAFNAVVYTIQREPKRGDHWTTFDTSELYIPSLKLMVRHHEVEFSDAPRSADVTAVTLPGDYVQSLLEAAMLRQRYYTIFDEIKAKLEYQALLSGAPIPSLSWMSQTSMVNAWQYISQMQVIESVSYSNGFNYCEVESWSEIHIPTLKLACNNSGAFIAEKPRNATLVRSNEDMGQNPKNVVSPLKVINIPHHLAERLHAAATLNSEAGLVIDKLTSHKSHYDIFVNDVYIKKSDSTKKPKM